MPKVIGIHTIMLHPGVKEEDFEKFVTEEIYPFIKSVMTPEGWELYLLKGLTGDREGKYLVMWEIDSLEAFHRFYPSPGEVSEEGRQFGEAHPEIMEKMGEKWATFSPHVLGNSTVYTDYVVVGK